MHGTLVASGWGEWLFSHTKVLDPGNTFKNWGQMCTSWVNL